MAKIRRASQAATLFLYLYLLTLSQLPFTKAKGTGFSLKLIHRDSPSSPLYPRNLTPHERIERLVAMSKARASQIKSSMMMGIETSNTTLHPNIIRPPVAEQEFVYVVLLFFGTPFNGYYLTLDTGSMLTWIQCQPCEHCFQQEAPLFDPHASSSYQQVPCNHLFCKEPFSCFGDVCVYEVTYIDKSSIKGVLSLETLTFLSDNGATEALNAVAFGCSHHNQGFNYPTENEIAGTLGMDRGFLSLATQLQDHTNKRFSYCLVDDSDTHLEGINSFLRFGDNIVINGGNVQTTPFITPPNNNRYGLNLLDISVGDYKLGFPAGTFAFKPDGSGGCIIDSGTTATHITQNAYVDLKNTVMLYFAASSLNVIPGRLNLDLCFEKPKDFNNYPTITFHFQGADLVVEPRSAFFIQDSFFCLGMIPMDGLTILGTLQQTNVRFIYDNAQSTLSFVKEDCTKDAF